MTYLFVKLCLISTGVCHQEMVTNSDVEPELNARSCVMAAPPKLAQFMGNRPQYNLMGWKCTPWENYEL